MNLSDIQHGMPVYARGRDQIAGKPVASIDRLDGPKYIKLRRSDSPDGRHHWIPLTWVDVIRNGAVFLNKTDSEYRQQVYSTAPEDSEQAQRAMLA